MFEHTADIGLSAKADDLPGLYEAMAEGLAELMCPRAQVEPGDSRELSIQAEDAEALLVDFLSEVRAIIQVDRFLVGTVHVRDVSETALMVELFGEPMDPDRHSLGHDVKAVTYHQLLVGKQDGKWVARVILDV